ncbi:hypothetical protein GCM10009616_06180 [Microlunatus lacustris]
MAVRRLTAEGPAPVGIVWQRYVETARWPDWSPQITRVDADAERIARGVSGTVHAVGGLRLRFTITDVDLVARRWSWLVRLGPVQLDLHHEVRAVPGGGSVTGLVLQGPTAVVTAYAPLAWVALRRLVAR